MSTHRCGAIDDQRAPRCRFLRKCEAAQAAHPRLPRAIARWGSSALFAIVLLGPMPAPAFQFGVAPNPVLALDSDQAGARPAHRLSFDVKSGELEVYRAAITYPDGFRFNGFDALGPLNSPVGALQVDFDLDGDPEITVLLRSLSSSSAYADIIADGRFTPALEPVLGHAGRTELSLLLPFGGDANRDSLVIPRAARVSVALFQGVLSNPDMGGTYTIRAELTSVDPDTDGADDGLNASPLTLAFEVGVSIAFPAGVLGPLFLHDGGGPGHLAALFLDGVAPSAPTAKYRDSSVVSFSGGNPWKEIGTWRAAPEATEGVLAGPIPLHVWIGLRNSDDQGTRFDLRADVEKNGATVATGSARCIAGVTRNPALATAVTVSVGPSAPVDFDGPTDILRLRIYARIGTNADGTRCTGPGGSHASATGLRLYFDSAGRDSVLGAFP